MSENMKSGYKCSLNYTPKNTQGEIKNIRRKITSVNPPFRYNVTTNAAKCSSYSMN